MAQKARRLGNIPPYAFATIAQRVSEIEAKGDSVIRLDMGSPDLPPPQIVVEALHASTMNEAHHGYGGFTGIAPLRKAFADYYARRFEVGLDVDREVLPLIGSKEGIVNIALALVNPGDVVLIPDLAYPAYAAGAYLAGAEPIEYHLLPDHGYLPDLEAIPENVVRRARLLWVNYPQNPTGAVASKEELTRIVEFCEQHDIMLCSDNPYADIAFDGRRPPSLLEVSDSMSRAVEFNSLSKTYNMAGWRVGVCVGNADMIDALLRVKSNVDSGLFRPIQDAACVALNEVSIDWIAERNSVYQKRRDIVLAALPEVGLSASAPEAGIYVWAKVRDGDDEQYARDALEKAHVSITPGRVYGSAGYGYVRFSLVTSDVQIEMAMEKMTAWQRTIP